MAVGSIVDYLSSSGRDSSYAARRKLAEEYGISGYSGTASQNTKLLGMLQNGSATNNAAKIQERLSRFRNMAGRQEILEIRGCTVIKDCYNAGPESMAAALNVLGHKPGRHIAVLGDMLELGVCTQAEHYRIGRIAAEKADVLMVYGPNAPRVIGGAITGGMNDRCAKAYDDQKKLAEALSRIARPGDVILVKGSRGMHMERVLDLFGKEDTKAEV